MTCRLSSVRSRTEPHAPQAIDSVCNSPRTVSGAPQLGHESVRTLGAARAGAAPAAAGDGLPSIELSQAAEGEVVEIDVVADKHERRGLAVVDGGEGASGSREIGHRRLVAGAHLER